jgi:hypothetical protein
VEFRVIWEIDIDARPALISNSPIDQILNGCHSYPCQEHFILPSCRDSHELAIGAGYGVEGVITTAMSGFRRS